MGQSTRNDYRLVGVWGRLSPELAADVVTFWEQQNAIPNPQERQRRTAEVACLAYAPDGAMAGVSTVYRRKLEGSSQEARDALLYRHFIAPAERKPLLFVSLFFGTCRVLEEAEHPDEVLFVAENAKMIRPGVRKRVLQANGCIPLGTDPQGQEVWTYPMRPDGPHRDVVIHAR